MNTCQKYCYYLMNNLHKDFNEIDKMIVELLAADK